MRAAVWVAAAAGVLVVAQHAEGRARRRADAELVAAVDGTTEAVRQLQAAGQGPAHTQQLGAEVAHIGAVATTLAVAVAAVVALATVADSLVWQGIMVLFLVLSVLVLVALIQVQNVLQPWVPRRARVRGGVRTPGGRRTVRRHEVTRTAPGRHAGRTRDVPRRAR